MSSYLPFVLPAAVAALVALFGPRSGETREIRLSTPGKALTRWRLRSLAVAAMSGAIVAIALWYFFASTPQGFDGTFERDSALPAWATNLSYFVAMIVGMLCQTIFDAIKTRKTGTAPVIDRWQIATPLLVSPMIFASVYSQLPASPEVRLLSLVLCFQNGFFWQDLMASLGPSKTAANPAPANPAPLNTAPPPTPAGG